GVGRRHPAQRDSRAKQRRMMRVVDPECVRFGVIEVERESRRAAGARLGRFTSVLRYLLSVQVHGEVLSVTAGVAVRKLNLEGIRTWSRHGNSPRPAYAE